MGLTLIQTPEVREITDLSLFGETTFQKLLRFYFTTRHSRNFSPTMLTSSSLPQSMLRIVYIGLKHFNRLKPALDERIATRNKAGKINTELLLYYMLSPGKFNYSRKVIFKETTPISE